MIRLLSWNLHGLPLLPRRATRLEAAGRAILAKEPSLVLLQEIWLQKDAEAITSLLMPAGFCAIGTNTRWGFRQSGLLTFVQTHQQSPVEAFSSHVVHRFLPFNASAPAWRVWEADGLMRKGLLEATLTSSSGERITVINTHLQAEYTDVAAVKRHRHIREQQLAQVIRAAAAAQSHGAVLIAGDFNTTPEESTIFREIGRAGWTELTANLRMTRGGGTQVPRRGEKAEWVDYVFATVPQHRSASSAADLISNTARDRPFSDHHGVLVDLALT